MKTAGTSPARKEEVSEARGLAQASPRPLPAIIDTPMARLDSEHRQHLIERYFPSAGHQVIILSTDTEVDRSQCRWALCVSLREPTPPSPIDVPADSNVEMTWLVSAGEHHELYLALLKRKRSQVGGAGCFLGCLRRGQSHFRGWIR